MPPSNKQLEEADVEMQAVDMSSSSTAASSLTENGKSLPSSPEQERLLEEDNNKKDSHHQHSLSSIFLGNIPALLACTMYSFCSVSMVLVNKSLASSYNHLLEHGNLNIFLVVVQAVVAVICVDFCKRMRWVEYPSLNWATARAWAPVNIFFCLMLFTSMAALQTNSVPMATVFKNVTNILTTAGDFVFFGSRPQVLVLLAFGVMLVGAIFAAKNDIYITGPGLFWMVANCVTTSGYVLYMKYATQSIKMSKFGMVYVNNVLCVVFLLPVAYGNGELHNFFQTRALHTVDYAFKNIFAGLVGFFLNFASLQCVSLTGPTTYAIVGSVNKIPVALLGWILFDNVISPQTWFFIMVSMTGGFLYSWAMIREARRKDKATQG